MVFPTPASRGFAIAAVVLLCLAPLKIGGTELLSAYLYSRAQSVMGGTSQIQKNIIASRILGLGV